MAIFIADFDEPWQMFTSELLDLRLAWFIPRDCKSVRSDWVDCIEWLLSRRSSLPCFLFLSNSWLSEAVESMEL